LTWYAHHVFASPAALVPLAAEFPGRVFHVRDLAEYRATHREVFAHLLPSSTSPGGPIERDVVEGPKVPEDGLVVVRELCNPDSHATEWFGDDAVSWIGHGTPHPAVLAPSRVLGDDVYWAPPEALLGLLRALSRATRSPVSLCCVGTWGGDIDHAFAWVFDGRWDADYAYHLAGPARVVARNAAAPDDPRTIVDGDVLTLTLVHHGVLLTDGGIFELHKRAFPWERHRVG
jgi:hypothetical protein